MIRLIFSTYFAAGFSFISSVLRDWSIISSTGYATTFFELIYFASVASGFMINSITLDAKAPTIRFCIFLTALSVLAVDIVGLFWFDKSFYFLTLVSLIVFLWIIGAIASRSLLVAGKIFYARIREGVASLIMVPLALLGVDLLPTIVIGVFLSTFWVLWLSRQHISSYFSKSNQISYLETFKPVVVSNLATVCILSWAIYFNEYSSKIFGLDSTVVVRIALYFFQALSIGSVVLVAKMPLLAYRVGRSSLQYSILCLLIGVLFSAINSSLGVVVMPCLAALSHYASIIYLHRHRSSANYL